MDPNADQHLLSNMTSTQTKIHQAAQRNRELLAVLSSTDHAIPDLEQKNRYIDDLAKQLDESNAKISNLYFMKEKELKEHEDYRDSIAKRFAYKISGKKDKFEERAAKEEREYFDVLQLEIQQKEIKETIIKMLDEAKRAKKKLEPQAASHQQAQRDLDNLYESVFHGPSPGFPEEDDRERESKDAMHAYQQARSLAESESQAFEILKNAQRFLESALSSMQQALGYSEWDICGGGNYTDVMERNALHQAELQVMQARMQVMQAQNMSPKSVRELPPVKISQGNIMSDVFFDNIFTDMAFHDKIKASNVEVERCANALNQNLEEVRTRYAELAADLNLKQQRLDETRAALQAARRVAFEGLFKYAQKT